MLATTDNGRWRGRTSKKGCYAQSFSWQKVIHALLAASPACFECYYKKRTEEYCPVRKKRIELKLKEEKFDEDEPVSDTQLIARCCWLIKGTASSFCRHRHCHMPLGMCETVRFKCSKSWNIKSTCVCVLEMEFIRLFWWSQWAVRIENRVVHECSKSDCFKIYYIPSNTSLKWTEFMQRSQNETR